ncbi:MAG: R3H domain-containing nucleic acid-binding protein [Nitriliruptoraceae bacterium]
MSRTVQARGESLEGALAEAISELLETRDGSVDVEVRGADLAAWSGRVRFDLEVAGTQTASEDDQVTEEADETRTPRGGAAAVSPRAPEEEVSPEELDEEADAAADFLEGLLDAMDLPGDLRIKLHDDHAELEVTDIGSGALIGRRGQTLEAIQELARCSLQRQFQRRARVKIDAEGYRARRMEKLIEKADEAIDAVLDSGEPERLEPMDVFERKAIHQLVAEVDGLLSRSQGREPARRVIIERE